MKLRVLGCSGGIGGKWGKTTSFMVDEDILIDAGTGVCDLPLDVLAGIDHVFLTHAHLDHIAALPLLLDSIAEQRGSKPVRVYALRDVLEVLRLHIFNWAIWPDFSVIPSPELPSMYYQEVKLGQSVVLAGRSFTPMPADHTVPACGYHVNSGAASLVLSGDSGPCGEFWKSLDEIENLEHLVIECAFPNEQQSLALVAKHYTPHWLLDELSRIAAKPSVHVTHLKPGKDRQTMSEITKVRRNVRCLRHNDVIEF